MLLLLCRLIDNRSGGTAIEYALLTGVIGLVVAGGMTALRTELSNVFTTLADAQKTP